MVPPTDLRQARTILVQHLLAILLLVELEVGAFLLGARRIARAVALLSCEVGHQLVPTLCPLLVGGRCEGTCLCLVI